MSRSWTGYRSGREVSRRRFLQGTSLAALQLAWAQTWLAAADGGPKAVGLIVREKEPVNLESPFAALKDFVTPTEQFYVRNHFAMPRMDAKTWRLNVVGAVEKPLELTYDQIKEMPSTTRPITLECAGNGRAFLGPKAKGVQWELGAVSTAEWTGVPLATILDRAGVRRDAVAVVLEGSDRGEPKNEPRPAGLISFARSLPLEKARKPEVLLAHEMNGKLLPDTHGFPLRAVVGGWYGMASVKWLNRIVVLNRPFHGYDQTTDYAIWERPEGLPTLTPITDLDVKASIADPAAGGVVPAGKDYCIHGAAWAGEADVTKVEVSTDGGKTWGAARLLDRPVPFCWRLWDFTWKAPAAGKHQLMARATDQRGRVQALWRDPDRRNYMISHVVPVEVEVRA